MKSEDLFNDIVCSCTVSSNFLKSASVFVALSIASFSRAIAVSAKAILSATPLLIFFVSESTPS